MREAAEGLVAGRYRANRKIGEGAIGEVWEGTHLALGIKIAIKRLLAVHQTNHELIARFRREAFLIGRVRSEYVARVIDFVTDDPAGPALVMEFIDGESLYDLLHRRLLSVEEAVALGSDVLAGLDELHRAQVVHRDLKPGNIIIEGRARGGHRAVLVDFGMGRIIPRGGATADGDDEPTGITRNGIALGTLEYMAPEQILNSRGVTGAADLYALGAILFRALTGRFPFTGESPMALVRAKLTEEAPPIVLARGDPLALGLIQIVAKALTRDVARRYQSAEEMLAHLNDLRSRIQPGQPLFASSPAARLSNEPLPPLSIPPPPSLPSLHTPRARTAPLGYADVVDDETLAMHASGRRPAYGPSSSAASGSMPSSASAPAPSHAGAPMPSHAGAPMPSHFGAPAPAGVGTTLASAGSGPLPAPPGRPMYGPPPQPGFAAPPPRQTGPIAPAPAPKSGSPLKVLGLALLTVFGLIIGGGLGLVYVIRREAAAPVAEARPAAEEPPAASEAPKAPPAPEALKAPAAASQAPEASARPASSGGAKNVIDLDDLPAEPPGQGRPSKPKGAR
ncbi:MAG TPA: protein kinase [Polyangiaceae bacterium]|nr:protein kinase [Polyangiaceae bacterium]